MSEADFQAVIAASMQTEIDRLEQELKDAKEAQDPEKQGE